ncbi:hypothetical protein [Methylocaldum szegediense]|jgi:hypothetical protein|uniref:Uncharacterized protein n=1 Tax=Methylocaldum szegediense TaxID=73780 RepID=A0ABN8X3F5_9GAMM|nr:hypothetical protein [Methylocaldum szegediense]CAI8852389.1 conserved exported protein of unknown function [Methylocaldum szegediense]
MKSYALAAVLSSMMVAGSAFADNDFRALGKVSNVTPMSEQQLAAVEGGACFGVLNTVNICVNLATPSVVGFNGSLFGLFGPVTQPVSQAVTQSIN